MTPAEILEQINETYNDWDWLLANPRFCRDGRFVSWTGFDGGRLKEPITTEQVLNIVESRQFSFQTVVDGSIFQLLYQFDDQNVLQIARLAFYLLKTRGSFEEGTAQLVSSAWIRLDYDLAAAKGVLHHESHLHIHGFPNARLTVSGIPGPRQFVELIVSLAYPDLYSDHRLDNTGTIRDAAAMALINSKYISCSQAAQEIPLIHLALP